MKQQGTAAAAHLAVGVLCARSGIVAAALLLLLSGLFYDPATRYGITRCRGAAGAWLGLMMLIFCIDLAQR
jgi:hypothetical protein